MIHHVKNGLVYKEGFTNLHLESINLSNYYNTKKKMHARFNLKYSPFWLSQLKAFQQGEVVPDKLLVCQLLLEALVYGESEPGQLPQLQQLRL